MAPEYAKAALGLYPLVPTYAVNCDKDSNKRLCSEQGVQGFPTIKACRSASLILLLRLIEKDSCTPAATVVNRLFSTALNARVVHFITGQYGMSHMALRRSIG